MATLPHWENENYGGPCCHQGLPHCLSPPGTAAPQKHFPPSCSERCQLKELREKQMFAGVLLPEPHRGQAGLTQSCWQGDAVATARTALGQQLLILMGFMEKCQPKDPLNHQGERSSSSRAQTQLLSPTTAPRCHLPSRDTARGTWQSPGDPSTHVARGTSSLSTSQGHSSTCSVGCSSWTRSLMRETKVI